ncbi:MAG: biotin/lipoyl-containing protein [Sphaerochaetaceae bacterium]
MDLDKISQLINLFEQSSLSAMEVESPEGRLSVKRENLAPPLKSEKVAKPTTGSHKIIKSPIVGTFYRTPSVDSPPYVEVGSKVKAGEVLCTLEAMKLMNQLEAEWDCEIVAILAQHATLVQFGQPLFEVAPL